MAKQKAEPEVTEGSPAVQTSEQLQTPVLQRRPGPIPGIQRWAASTPNDTSGLGAAARARNSRSLQRQAGNAHLSLPSGGVVQPKLAVNQPGESYEQESGRGIENVMRMHQPNGSNGLGSGSATKSALENAGGGHPLPQATRKQMESSLGADLSNVNIHTDEQAARASQELNAEAFTTGQDVYFGQGCYQPHTSQGQQLLAHELTHTIQQGSTTDEPSRQTEPTVSRPDDPLEREADAVADQIVTGAQATTPTISKSTPEARTKLSRQENETVPAQAEAAPIPPAEPVSLAGAGPFPPPAVAAYVDTLGSADIPVQLGSIAQGTIPIEKHRNSYRTPGRGRAAYRPIPLMHPALQPLRDAGVNPVLAVRIQNGILDGYVTIATEEGAAGNPAALVNWIKEHATEMGWLGMDISRIPDPVNEMSDGVLRLQLNNFPFRLGGFIQGTGSFGLANEAVNFSATASISVENLSEAQLEISRDEEGHLAGRAEVPVEIANFSGNLIAEYGNGTVNIQGTIGYNADKFSGEVTLLVTDRQTARNVARQQLGPEAIAASAQEAAGASEGSEGPIPGPRALAGFGTLNFAFTEWMTGSAQVIIDNEGHITVVGEIAPPAEVELFPQRDYIYELFSTEIRTLYGVPLVGNVFLFANIGIDALAKLGPGKIYNIAVRGRYSTDPEVLQNYELEATLNISAFAGLRLRAEGGVGVELAGHDIKAGVGVMGLAGVRGYVEATPTIGYRETADPEEGRHGEYFINGHMEIAAQPFLGLSGDLFVELDSPWWSPAPDDKWTWPLGELEYPLPGEFGIGADVDYVIGSDELPEIQFGEVDFSADRFMTDLVNDHVPPRRGGEQEQPGEWQEGETTGETAEPTVNETEAPPAVQEPAQGQQTPDQGEPPAPNVQQQWLEGMQALGGLAQQSQNEPFNEVEINTALARIKRQYGFSELRATRVGEDWSVYAQMNPDNRNNPIRLEGETPLEEELGVRRPPWVPDFVTAAEVVRVNSLYEQINLAGASDYRKRRFRDIIRESGDLVNLRQILSRFEQGLEELGEGRRAAEEAEEAPLTSFEAAAHTPGAELEQAREIGAARPPAGISVTTTPSGHQRRPTEIGNYVHRYAELMSAEGLLTPALPTRRLVAEHPFLGRHYLYNRTLRADRINFEDKVVYEIKPAHRLREGQAQVAYYVERANIELGGDPPWQGVVITYDPERAGEYLASIGVFED